MKIVIAGGSGFLGRTAAAHLISSHDVYVLTRNAAHVKTGTPVVWNSAAGGPWQEVVATADAVINLAGENIGEGRWTRERKEALVRSRVATTAALAGALRNAPRPERLFISASAVGYYGDRGDEVLTESSSAGSDFLAQLCRDWESNAREAESAARVVVLRFGVVFDKRDGAFPRLARPVRWFAGGPVGSGRQWISWVDSSDVVRIIDWCLGNDVRGVYNATSPSPVRNRDLIRAVAKRLHRPSFARVPAPLLRLILGEMGEALLLSSQRAEPQRLLAGGFRFQYDGAPAEVDHLLAAS